MPEPSDARSDRLAQTSQTGDQASSRREGPLPLWVGRIVEPLYAAAIGSRNRRYDAGRGVTHLDVPVISVGNLSVGGTGKSPMVAHLVALLLQDGFAPCIAMRGYAKRRGQSDEADEYRRAFPGVPIVAQPDRIAGLRQVLESVAPARRAVDCVVLDDGFQHRRIARDIDIVLVDASRPPQADRLLPAGWLREPVRNLRRASLVVVTHAEQVDGPALRRVVDEIRAEHGQEPLCVTRHVWTGLKMGDGEVVMPLDALLEKRVVGCCAIGNPRAFMKSLKATASPGMVVGELALPDHDAFEGATVERLIALAQSRRAEWIVVTDKDWSKLRRVRTDRWPCPMLRPVLQLGFDRGASELRERVLAVARKGMRGERGNRSGEVGGQGVKPTPGDAS